MNKNDEKYKRNGKKNKQNRTKKGTKMQKKEIKTNELVSYKICKLDV